MQVRNIYPGMEIKYECIGHVQKKGLDADYKMLRDEIKVSVVKVNFP